MDKTYKIQLKGQVQGVGFRPFVFKLAKQLQLNGTVSNNENGVVIFCVTSEKYAQQFLSKILQDKPEVAIITAHSIIEVPTEAFPNFSIVSSEVDSQINLPLTPDFAICDSCKTEVSDEKNRRFKYAFTTCVHCGPRYAITTKFPFERAHTSLQSFEMCPICSEEYTNPNNKRFHSQTNSCKSCGIQLQLVTASSENCTNTPQEMIPLVAQFLSEGAIVAIKNTNGYLLCCDASNPEAIATLRARKKRPNKPFAVLYPSIASIEKEFDVAASEAQLLQSRVAPIVILENTKNTTIAVSDIAPNLHQTGVLLPSSALLEVLMQHLKKPIVATSGNMHGSPILSEEKEATKQLNMVADYFVHHNLEIQFPQDDSVVKVSNQQHLILRRSRGLAPNYIDVSTPSTVPILAMGAHLKSTFAFLPNEQLYVSQYFGNLDSYDVSERYKTTLQQFFDLFETLPKTILVDKHLHYQSRILGTEFASEWRAKLQEIQHHKAHFASVLGEHDLFASEEEILGVVWDGTGLGDDNQIWGGEFFTYQNKGINRLTHFEYYDWLANDKMAKEPRLALFSLLKEEERDLVKHKFSDVEWNVYIKMSATNILKTSSVGRLFDAVASALHIVDINTFEAEAAMRLEDCAHSYSEEECIDFLAGKDYDEIPSKEIITALVNAKKEGDSNSKLAFSFLYTLAKIIITVAQKNALKIIVCSGGVFQNSVLCKLLLHLTQKEGMDLKLNRKLSSNDENISFGQVMYHLNIKN